MKRRTALSSLAAVLAASRAFAQTAARWPDKPVHWILSQPAGSGPDNVARLLAEQLQRSWGQAVVVDNKPGGQNTIGAQAAARSPADGYNFYFATTAALVSNAYLFKTLPYEPLKSFAPVAFIGRSPFGLIVEASSPIASLADFIARAKAEPGRVSVATEGPRTFGGIIARLIDARAGIKTNLVSYASVGVALQDVIGGHANVAVADLASSAALIRQGRLRLLAVTSAQRQPGWDNVPAIAEQLQSFDMVGWLALVAPAGTPPEVIARVAKDTAAVLGQNDVAERIHTIGPRVDTRSASPEALAALLREEHARWALIAQEIGLLPE